MYSLVSFIPLDITDESSIDDVLGAIDASLQFGEDQEVRVPVSFQAFLCDCKSTNTYMA
jgi:hypothetical protein